MHPKKSGVGQAISESNLIYIKQLVNQPYRNAPV